MEHDELAHWIALNQTGVVGPVRLEQLLSLFGTAEEAWLSVTPQSLSRLGWGSGVQAKFLQARRDIDPEECLARVVGGGFSVLTTRDTAYPPYLKEISDPPPVLYIDGDPEVFAKGALAIVGSRRSTSYGRDVASQFSGELALSELVIISGLALGIDAVAHQGCLDVGGITVVVLASGVDKATPQANARLAQDILDGGGAIISEFPLGTDPQPFHFPIRNRIISGLSLGVLVVEAGEKSGALITARCAADQGREVFAIPGSVFSGPSSGTAKLIREGATLVTSPAQILEALEWGRRMPVSNGAALSPSPTEASILEGLGEEPKYLDELVILTKLSSTELLSTLTLLEMKGMVAEVGGRYRRVHGK